MVTQAAQAKVLRIGIVQDKKLVQQRLIKANDPVTIGDAPKNTFVMTIQGLGAPQYELFVVKRGEGYALRFNAAMKGKIRIDGEPAVTLEQLRSDPKVERSGDDWIAPLSEKHKGKIIIEDVEVLFQFVAPPPPQAVKPIEAMNFRPPLFGEDDPVFFGFLALFTALGAVLLVWIWNTEPPVTKSIDQIPDRFTKLVLEPPPEVEAPEPDEQPTELDDTLTKPEETTPEQKAEEVKPKEAPKTELEKAKRTEELKEAVQNKSLLLKMMVTRGESSSGPLQGGLWSGDDAGLQDLDAAVKGVSKAEVATNKQDLRKGAAGERGDVDIGKLEGVGGGSTEIGKGPEVAVQGQVDLGAADFETMSDGGAVKEVVSRNFGQLTYCYEQQLKANPSLGGRVEIEFVVSGGRVTSANVFANTTGNSDLGRCIVGKIRRWRFPTSVEGEILYPFIFKRSG